MAERKVTINIIGDASKAVAAFDKAGVSVSGFDSKLGSVAKIAGGFVIGAAMTQLPGLMSSAAKEAVSLEQNAKKAALVFGDSLPTVSQWADESAAAMGLTDDQATTLATNMADLLIPMGMSREEAAKMSTETIGLAGALSEWSGGTKTAAEVSEILTSAMLGETDGLKALGISISAADIQARLAANGQDKLTGAALQQATALATQQLVMEKSVDAQTAFANGADTTARKQAEATAAMAEAKEQLSTALLPAVTAMTTAFAAFAILLSGTVVPAIIAIVGAFGPVIGFIQDNLTPALILLGTAFTTLAVVGIPLLITAIQAKIVALYNMAAAWVVANASMLPIIAVVLAIGVAIAALAYAWENNFLGIQDITKQFFDWIMPYITTALATIQTVWNTVLPYIQLVTETVFAAIQTYVTTYIAVVQAVIETTLGVIQTVWNTVFPVLQAVVETVFPIIATAVTTYIGIVQAVIETALGVVTTVWNTVFPAIQTVTENVMTGIQSAVTTGMLIVDTISTGLSTISGLFNDVLVPVQGVVSDVFSTIASTVETLWNSGAVLSIATGLGTIKGLFTGIYDTMRAFGSSMVQGLIDGANALIGPLEAVWGVISAIADKIITAKNLISSPSRLMHKRGEQLMQGLINGVGSMMPTYLALAGDVAGVLPGSVGAAGGNPFPMPGGGGMAPGVGGGGASGGSGIGGSGGGAAGGSGIGGSCPPGTIRAEDGSCVPLSFYECPPGHIKAEDGSCVPLSFYGGGGAPGGSGIGGSCPAGTIRAEDGSCVPLSFYECPPGHVRAEDGSCVPLSFYNNLGSYNGGSNGMAGGGSMGQNSNIVGGKGVNVYVTLDSEPIAATVSRRVMPAPSIVGW